MKLNKTLTLTTITASSLIVAVVTIAVLLLLHHSYQNALEKRGRELANILAHDPHIMSVVQQSNDGDNHTNLQHYIEQLRKHTDASYMVVVNQQALRLSHPDEYKLGKHFIGDDIYPSLRRASSYSTKAIGSLGEAIRNFTSIVDHKGQVIGAICIGYLSEKISDIWYHQYLQISAIIGVVYLLGLGATLFFFIKMKRTFFNFEPEYVAHKFREYALMFDSIRDAIIATDSNLQITNINKQAATVLSMGTYSQDDYIGHPLTRYSESLSHLLLPHPDRIQQGEFSIGKLTFNALIYPITTAEKTVGYVVVFFTKTAENELRQELTYFKNYAELLRSKTHEYANKLNVLSGMLQLGNYDDCLNVIQKETDHYQAVVHRIVVAFADSAIAGLLLAKYNKASEMGVSYLIDPDSNLSGYTKDTSDKLITMIGNLLDNALLAAWQNRQHVDPEISLYISDRNRHLFIDIEDNGAGISEHIANHILDFGASTKTTSEQTGVGLYLVNQLVNYYNGTLDWERTAANTTLFSICIPKEGLAPHE